jgi:Skp family chaperone for outer membrane proteins
MPKPLPIRWRMALTAGLSMAGCLALAGHSSGQQDGGVQKASTSQPAAAARPGPAVIGTIDMDAVLKTYEKYKAQMESMKVDMLARQKDLMKIQEEGKQLGEMMSKFQPSSPDYKRIEKQFAQLKAQFQVANEQASSEFQQREADMLATIYNEVQGMTASVAKLHGMSFVVRVSREPVSGSEPNSVMSALARSVVFSDPVTDVTNEVVKYLNINYRRTTGAAAPKAAAATPPASTQPSTAR